MKRVFQVKLYPHIIKQLGVSPVYTVVCDRRRDIATVILKLSPQRDPATAPVLRFIERGHFDADELPLDQDGVY